MNYGGGSPPTNINLEQFAALDFTAGKSRIEIPVEKGAEIDLLGKGFGGAGAAGTDIHHLIYKFIRRPAI